MRCDDVQMDLSARLDGEAETQPRALVDAHLAGCAGCRSWLARAERVTRAVRVQSVDVPDLTERILAAVHAEGRLAAAVGPRAAAGRSWGWLRGTLGALAVVQLMLAVPDMLGVPALFGVAGHDAHTGREVAAFDIAIAVGLLIVACYPEHARIFAPVVLTLAVCFASISAIDVMQGVVTPARVAVHAISLVQAGLLWSLARRAEPRPATA